MAKSLSKSVFQRSVKPQPAIPRRLKKSIRRFQKKSFRRKQPSYFGGRSIITTRPSGQLALPAKSTVDIPPSKSVRNVLASSQSPALPSISVRDLDKARWGISNAVFKKLNDVKMTTAIRQYANRSQPPTLLDRLSNGFSNFFGTGRVDPRAQVDNRRRRR